MYTFRSFFLVAAVLTALGCGNDNTNPPTDGDPGGNDGGNNGGNTGGGPVGSIIVGNTFFQSAHNGTKNPAVDTVAANTTVTWAWTSTGTTPHSVRSQGSPSFTSSDTKTGNGSTFTASFATPGTYQYDCAVHGSAMTGRVVVVQ